MTRDDYLLEIGVEELPPKSIPKLITSLGEGIARELSNVQIEFDDIREFATPRRLAVIVQSMADEQPEQAIERRGPSLEAAFDDAGKPTQAAIGFARSCGLDNPDSLDRMETDKGTWLVYRDRRPGERIDTLIGGVVDRALASLPIERAMRWGATKRPFVRPVHWVVSLYGETILPLTLFGVAANRESQGHRFMAKGNITIKHANEYKEVLGSAKVIADFNKRRTLIQSQLDAISQGANAKVVVDPDLLDEVTALVEWPQALCGNFDQKFLEVPEEALISAMKSHQRYFHLTRDDGHLVPRFITIANIESPRPELVVAGNERVIVPRLADAAFFFEQDRKTTLAAKTERLRHVVFQSQLGTYHDKSSRVSRLAGDIESRLGLSVDAARAGLLCKADLVSDMVIEFTDLQGIMGAHYARHDGESANVCDAIREHYRPVQSGGDIPATDGGRIVAMADKLDTLTGIFGIGQPPTGSRDPFALRRQSLGVVRILIEGGYDLDLFSLVDSAGELHSQSFDTKPLKDYLMERLAVFYQDQGIQSDTFEAARHANLTGMVLVDFDQRVRAIQSFRERAEAGSLVAANKRVANLLRQIDTSELGEVNPDQFKVKVEQEFFDALETKRVSLQQIKEFDAQLMSLSELQDVVDRYFDDVLVMDEDPDVRSNRLASLAQMRQVFLEVADVSMLQV